MSLSTPAGLPATFQFSQSSLQDYADCPRRFQLRYVASQAWPGVQAEPLLEHERHLERSIRFHRLVQRHQLGVPADMLSATVGDPGLRAWWDAYLAFDFLHALQARRYPEFTLSTEVAGARLTATFDLLVIVPGERAIIFDWKTLGHVPSRRWFDERLQTRVYPYVLARAGADLFGSPIEAERISLIYWLVSAPRDPVMFAYDRDRFLRDAAYLEMMIAEIRGAEPGGVWRLTSDETRCRFCEYRSLCGRGVAAGAIQPGEYSELAEREAALGLSLSDVDEVGF